MNKLWKITKWLLGALILFGGFILSDVLRGTPITPRSYTVAALMAGFWAINSLPPKWTVQQRFAFNFCYLFFSMPAVFFYFGEPFIAIHRKPHTVLRRFAVQPRTAFSGAPCLKLSVDGYTWTDYIFMPLGLALIMAAIFFIWGEQAKP